MLSKEKSRLHYHPKFDIKKKKRKKKDFIRKDPTDEGPHLKEFYPTPIPPVIQPANENQKLVDLPNLHLSSKNDISRHHMSTSAKIVHRSTPISCQAKDQVSISHPLPSTPPMITKFHPPPISILMSVKNLQRPIV